MHSACLLAPAHPLGRKGKIYIAVPGFEGSLAEANKLLDQTSLIWRARALRISQSQHFSYSDSNLRIPGHHHIVQCVLMLSDPSLCASSSCCSS
eukprot:scaffold52800_cov19-Tisochrysis_lutea.AAC.3